MDRNTLNAARGILALAVLWGYRLGRGALAWLLLARWLEPAAASVLILLILAMRQLWLMRLAACVGLILLWHWPWWAAILGAAPRLPLLLPGLIRTYLAPLRHPRPRWPAPAPALAPAAAPGSAAAPARSETR